jgi:hypothetical protein
MEGKATKLRSELFEEIIIHLDTAAGEVRVGGPESLADYIEEVLIPFVEGSSGQRSSRKYKHRKGYGGGDDHHGHTGQADRGRYGVLMVEHGASVASRTEDSVTFVARQSMGAGLTRRFCSGWACRILAVLCRLQPRTG